MIGRRICCWWLALLSACGELRAALGIKGLPEELLLLGLLDFGIIAVWITLRNLPTVGSMSSGLITSSSSLSKKVQKRSTIKNIYKHISAIANQTPEIVKGCRKLYRQNW